MLFAAAKHGRQPMTLPFKKTLRVLAAAVVFTVFSSGSVFAEPVPLPKIDYEAKAKLLNEGTLFIRHSNGKMRIEMQMPQLPQPAVGFIDLERKRMVLLLPIPGIQDTAMEVEFGDEAAFGQVLGEGERGAEITVAGERCAQWKIKTNEEDRVVACLARDNIALRTQVGIDGKWRTIFEVTELKRQAQNPADLEPPANLRIMKLPKGMKGIPGFPRL
jgi:hypothetical protein